jgi:hypothetical protein
MNLFGREVSGFAKALVILVAVFLVASGMCGLTLILAKTAMNGSSGNVLLPFGVIELIAMLLSAAGIVLVLIAWGITAAVGNVSNAPKGGVQKLMDSKEHHEDREEDESRDEK